MYISIATVMLGLSVGMTGMTGTKGTTGVELPRFAPPVPLRANGEVIDVTTGHAAPCIIDFDGDGVKDLLVGEFGSGAFKGETSGKASPGHPWAAGKLRVYRNTGTDQAPSYGKFHYLQAGGQDAQVPITCCVSFVPQFVDFNGDGRTDLVTGSYPGDIYFYPRNTEGGFDAPALQRDVDGNPVHARYEYRGQYQDISSVTVELYDMDADDDLDMVIGSRLNGCYTVENLGTVTEPKWSATSEAMKTEGGKAIGGWDYGSNVHFADWDEDGQSDIVVGSENGGVFWHRNLGTENAPSFGEMKTLLLEQPIDEHFLKLETPMWPSSRVKVHVVDYDGDGLQDLLVGDFGMKWSRTQTLNAAQKAELRLLEAELRDIRDASSAEVEKLTNNDERGEYFDAQSKKTAPLRSRIDEFETHRHESTGYVWFFKRLPSGVSPVGGIAQEPKVSPRRRVKLLSLGADLTSSDSFPVTMVVPIPKGWTACGNAEVMASAKSIGLATSIEWTLPDGCSIRDVSWQDADEHGLYDGTFMIEAVVDGSGIKRGGTGIIAADVRYQRCDKKSGLCVLEQERVELPVTLSP